MTRGTARDRSVIRAGAYGISAYSWSNALGSGRWIVGEPPPPWNLSARGLTPVGNAHPFPAYWGRVPKDPSELPAEVTHHLSRCARLFWASLEPLLGEVRRTVEQYGADRIGLVIGSSTGGIDVTETALAEERATGRFPETYRFEDLHSYDALVRLTAALLGLNGPGYVISTACSSSGKAIAAAQRLLDAGTCDAVLTGGADALCGLTVRGFSSLGILSPHACRPFDKTRSGITIGEGSALLLLERETASELSLLSAGEASDAFHATAPHPEGLGARLAIEEALAAARLEPECVDYVNAHGTGTAQNDAIEALTLASIGGLSAPFSSTKDRTGHMLGAAGATEAVFCLEALSHGRVPENHSPAEIDRTLARQPIIESREAKLETALSNSFAFGGSNVTLALGRRVTRDNTNAQLEGAAHVVSVAFWSPEFESVEAWRSGSPTGEGGVPAARLLPARARGRASRLTRMFAELLAQLTLEERAEQAPPVDLATVPIITGSAYGELGTTLTLLDQLAEDGVLSPAKFQASVHNAAAGQLSIATGNRSYSTSIAAGRATVAMGLVEAVTFLSVRGGEILLLAADEEAPTRLRHGRTYPPLALGLRLAWATEPPRGSLGHVSRIRREITRAPGADGSPEEQNPISEGLSLLRHLLDGRSGTVSIAPHWSIDVAPSR